MNAIQQLHMEAWRTQDFNGIWTPNFAITVRCLNQLSYQATDVGDWSFLDSIEPVHKEWMNNE